MALERLVSQVWALSYVRQFSHDALRFFVLPCSSATWMVTARNAETSKRQALTRFQPVNHEPELQFHEDWFWAGCPATWKMTTFSNPPFFIRNNPHTHQPRSYFNIILVSGFWCLKHWLCYAHSSHAGSKLETEALEFCHFELILIRQVHRILLRYLYILNSVCTQRQGCLIGPGSQSKRSWKRECLDDLYNTIKSATSLSIYFF